MHDELTGGYYNMIHADTAAEIGKRRKALTPKWHLKCLAVADSLDEGGDRLFTFTRLEPSQWKSTRTTNAIERLNKEFRRRIKTQTALPCAKSVPILPRALIASGQFQVRKVNGWETLAQPIVPISLSSRSALTSRPEKAQIHKLGECRQKISTTFETLPQDFIDLSRPAN